MNRSIAWEWVGEPGLEHLIVRGDENGVRAAGTVVGSLEDALLRVRYRVDCAAGFLFRAAEVEVESGMEPRFRRIERSEAGHWTVDGQVRSDLAGCLEIDIMVTPFTNTLPIRRLGLAEGEEATVEAAYVRLPDLDVSPATQSYTRLGTNRYRYASPGFAAELTIDGDGLVIDYGDIWRRIG